MLIKSCCLLLFIFSECLTTKITELAVPGELQLGSREAQEVFLDCQYDLENGTTAGLVVYWYLNDSRIYQWIMGSEPTTRALLKDHIVHNYNISSETDQLYRAIRLIDPGIAFSGDYKCVVSTDDSEDRKVKRMQFYDPGEGPTLSYNVTAVTAGNETGDAAAGDVSSVLAIKCEAFGMFPQPEFNITVNGQLVHQTQSNWKSADGLYNSTVEASMPVTDLSGGEELRCDLTLPYTSYKSYDYKTYSDGEVTREPPVEEGRPAAVGADSRWAAGGTAVAGGLSASWLLMLAGFAASLTQRHLVLHRSPH